MDSIDERWDSYSVGYDGNNNHDADECYWMVDGY